VAFTRYGTHSGSGPHEARNPNRRWKHGALKRAQSVTLAGVSLNTKKKIHRSFRRRREHKADGIVLLSAAIAICGIIQFVQGIWMAIEHYPYAFNPALEFLSVLGAQSASAPYFTRATVTLGVSMWPMFYSVVHQFGDDVPTSVVTFSALGIVSSFGLCGIGTTPYNQYYTMHYVAVAAWLLPMLVMLPLKIPQPGQPRIFRCNYYPDHCCCICVHHRFAVAGTSSGQSCDAHDIQSKAAYRHCITLDGVVCSRHHLHGIPCSVESIIVLPPDSM
jgi:hypothetical protein